MDKPKSPSIHYEKALLGGILLDGEMFSQVADRLTEADFAGKNHARIWKAMLALSKRGQAIDILTTLNEMAVKAEKSEQAHQYLTSLIDEVPTLANLKQYADIIVKASVRRSLSVLTTKIGKDLSSPENELPEASSELQRGLNEQVERLAQARPTNISDLSTLAYANFEKAYESTESAGLPTGMVDLDRVLGGLHQSDLIIVAARAGMGKTCFGLNLVNNALEKGFRALFYSLEMSAEQIIQRLLAMRAGIDSWRIRQGDLTEREYNSVSKRLTELSEAKLDIDDTAAVDINQLRARIHQQHQKHPLDLVVVDYIQLMAGTTQAGKESRNREVAEISRGLKIIAKEIDRPVVALSQLNRDSARREEKRPQLVDLRDSGAIEQDADIVLMLHRDDYYEEDKNKGVAELLIRKHRNGATGTIKLSFDPGVQRYRAYFEDVNKADQEQVDGAVPF